MDIKELQAHWNKFGETDPLWRILAWSDKADGRWQVDEFFATGVREIDEVMGYVRSLGIRLNYERALDFGCGVGRLTQALARYFQHVDGVDISQAMIHLARHYNQYGEQCAYYLNEVDDLRLFPDDAFDLIYSNITLQHMEPKYALAYIGEFVRILAPGGVLIFQVPGRARQWYRRLIQPLKTTPLFRLYHRLRYRDHPVMEMYNIRRQKVLRHLQARGAQVVDVRQDESADAHWISFRYCVIKGGSEESGLSFHSP